MTQLSTEHTPKVEDFFSAMDPSNSSSAYRMNANACMVNEIFRSGSSAYVSLFWEQGHQALSRTDAEPCPMLRLA
jgi:hypothetical protein